MLTLASPGAAGSLGNAKNIVIDNTTPTVGSVTSSTANGTYKAGATNFSVTSNTTSTCYYAGNPAICNGAGDPNAPKCANGADDDGDGLSDFPDDPGCDSLTDNNETDTPPASNVKSRGLIGFDTAASTSSS